MIIPELGEQQHRAVLVVEILAVLKGHIEEVALIGRKLLVESVRDRVFGDRQRQVVGRIGSAWPRNMLRGNWSNRITPASARQRIAEEGIDRKLPLLEPELEEIAA